MPDEPTHLSTSASLEVYGHLCAAQAIITSVPKPYCEHYTWCNARAEIHDAIVVFAADMGLSVPA